MESEERNYQGFQVKYIRQGGSNRWEATTVRMQGLTTGKTESGLLFITLWGNQTLADGKRASVQVLVERDPRLFDMSREVEDAWIAMTEKANQIADSEFKKRYQGAEIEHTDTGVI